MNSMHSLGARVGTVETIVTIVVILGVCAVNGGVEKVLL